VNPKMSDAAGRADSWREAAAGLIAQHNAQRVEAGCALALDAHIIARVCDAIAQRFQRGGKLLVFGHGACGADARHVAVEFVHPVIVGKRALPAIALTNDVASLTATANGSAFDQRFAHQVRSLGRPDDIAMGLSCDGNSADVLIGLRVAREGGLLAIGLCGSGSDAMVPGEVADFVLVAHSADPLIVKELHVTTYHILWELVHVFLEQSSGYSSPVNRETPGEGPRASQSNLADVSNPANLK
jgi:D-sedoheptulose 7-phosphate isomerase